MSTTKPPIPVNVIAGPLGVGKTTAINQLLAQRPENEKWAILINEYGMVGLDAALVSDAARPNSVVVREVAGGCICCSASFLFDVSLVVLLQRRPDRLIIEPTGLAELSGILDTLGRSGIRESIDVRSIITLLDPAKLYKDLQREEVKDQVDAADILLASRTDLASLDHLEYFDAWTQDLFPRKRHIGRIVQGQIPVDLLDLVTDRTEPPTGAAVEPGAKRHLHDHGPHQHDHGHHAHDHGHHAHDHGHQAHDHGHQTHDHGHQAHDHGHQAPSSDGASNGIVSDAAHPIVRLDHLSVAASTVGWVIYKALVFDSIRVTDWLKQASTLPGTRRVKAVLNTTEGWWSFNSADGAEEIRPTGYRRDSRLELVIESDATPHPEALEASLRDCLVDSPS